MSDRYKYWQFVVYPESAPNDWKERLNATQVPCAISPMHKSDEEVGKAHFHVLLAFYRPCTDKRAREVCCACGGANGFVQCVYAPLGAYEYLTHKNNPDKEQFGDVLPELFNGFVVPSIKLDDEAMFTECQDLIFDYNITEFRDLCKWFRNNGAKEKGNWCMRHANGLNALMNSMRYGREEDLRIEREERERNEDEARRKGFKYEDFCEEKEDNPFS